MKHRTQAKDVRKRYDPFENQGKDGQQAKTNKGKRQEFQALPSDRSEGGLGAQLDKKTAEVLKVKRVQKYPSMKS